METLIASLGDADPRAAAWAAYVLAKAVLPHAKDARKRPAKVLEAVWDWLRGRPHQHRQAQPQAGDAAPCVGRCDGALQRSGRARHQGHGDRPRLHRDIHAVSAACSAQIQAAIFASIKSHSTADVAWNASKHACDAMVARPYDDGPYAYSRDGKPRNPEAFRPGGIPNPEFEHPVDEQALDEAWRELYDCLRRILRRPSRPDRGGCRSRRRDRTRTRFRGDGLRGDGLRCDRPAICGVQSCDSKESKNWIRAGRPR